MNSILRTINDLIDKGYLIEEIDFDFLDDQCACFNDSYANESELLSRSSDFNFKLKPRLYIDKYYSLITNLDVIVYKDGFDHYDSDGLYDVWQEIDIIINTNDKYIISIIDEILNHNRDYSFRTEKKTTIFSFRSDENRSPYPLRSKVLADEKTHNQKKVSYIQHLLVSGIQLIPQRNIIEFFSTKKFKKT